MRYQPGTDIFTDSLYQQLEAIPAFTDLEYPIEIEAERAEMEIDPECMVELIRMLHGSDAKQNVVTDLKAR